MATEDHSAIDFSYGPAVRDDFGPGKAAPVSLSVIADRPALRASLRDDATALGLNVISTTSLDALLNNGVLPLGDIVLLDCPQVDGAALAALARIDERAVQACVRLIVSTTMEALDDVFGCMDQSFPVLLVDPGRADRLLAIGQVLAELQRSGLRELSENDRLMLLRLTEQVGQIAGQIERLSPGQPTAVAAATGTGSTREPSAGVWRSAGAPPLPDPRLVRRIIRQRQLRERFLGSDLFADPAWDMMLDLTAARGEAIRVSVTSLCIASGVPPTTALRWISQMVDAGLFRRTCDENDRRRAFIELSDKAADAMARYFAEIDISMPVPV